MDLGQILSFPFANITMRKKTSNAGSPVARAYEVHGLLSTGWTLMSIFDEQGPALSDAAALARASKHSGVRVLEAPSDSRSHRRCVAAIHGPGFEEPGTSAFRKGWPTGADIRCVALAITAIVAAGMAAGVALGGVARLGW